VIVGWGINTVTPLLMAHGRFGIALRTCEVFKYFSNSDIVIPAMTDIISVERLLSCGLLCEKPLNA